MDQSSNSIKPLVNDKFAWDAFVALLTAEEAKHIALLKAPQPPEMLIRLNAKLELLHYLKQTKDIINARIHG